MKPKRFGVVRTDRIGDLILSLPVAEAIKDAVPDAHVCFTTSPYTAGVARCCPYIDEVAEYSETTDRLAGFVGLCREFRRLGLDVALFLRPTPRAALAAALAGVRVRAGTSYRFYSFLFNRSVAEHRKHADRHESDYNLRLLESVLEIKSGPYRPRLEIRAESRPFAEEAMSRLGVRPGHFVIVHPGSGGSARNFTPENYAWLADFIEHELDLKAVLTYGKGEEALIDRIDSMRERNSIRLAGPDNLMELAAFIESSRLLVSGSTGPMHMAAALGVRTLSFFAPVRSCSPRRWGPLSDSAEVLMPPVEECPTCIGAKCEHYDCMDKIDRSSVADAIRRLVK